MLRRKSLALIAAGWIGLLADIEAIAAPAWLEQGPGPILDGLDVEDAGATNAIVADPNSADVVFVGTVNGGVWKTSNATAATPTWTPLTDTQLPALSIDSLAMSPVNPNTLFAGTGSTSSKGFGFNG